MTETRKPDTSPMRFLEIKNQHEAMRRSGYVGALGFLVTDDLIAMVEALSTRVIELETELENKDQALGAARMGESW